MEGRTGVRDPGPTHVKGGGKLAASRVSGDHRVPSCARAVRRAVRGPALWRRGRRAAGSTLVALAVCLLAAAGASAFNAQGSAEQVYVTGTAPNAQISLLNSGGST